MAQLSIRIDFGPEFRIGPGKIALLEQVAALGSISAAGRAMEMSYRRAWELIDDLNTTFGKPVVDSQERRQEGRRRHADAAGPQPDLALPGDGAGGGGGHRGAS